MKRILAILLVLCLLPLAALAEDCDVCSGDGVCDLCMGLGYNEMKAYDSDAIVKVDCLRCSGSGRCPFCAEPCALCGDSGMCSRCSGAGLMEMKAYGSDETVKVECPDCEGRGLCSACTVTDLPYVFQDAAVEQTVREALGKTGEITHGDLERIDSLIIEAVSLTTLADLRAMPNLTGLGVWDCTIEDISALSSLTKLEMLFLDNNALTDLSPLSDLTNLTALDLSDNQISDLSPLAALTSLTELDLSNNQFGDLSPLSGMVHMEELYLEANRVEDLSPLAGMTGLNLLDLYNNQISDISPLAGLTALERIDLGGNRIADISALSGLTGLAQLGLTGNQISDISPLAGLTGLNTLHLAENQISDFSVLDGLSIPEENLRTDSNPGAYAPAGNPDEVYTFLDASVETVVQEKLEISGPITHGDLQSITSFMLYDVSVSTLADLPAMSNLTSLAVVDCFIEDISPLASMTKLEKLSLCRNLIKDISPLASMTNLRELDLSENQISDISPLAGMVNLEWLHLYENQISDFSVLDGLSVPADSLYTGNNPGVYVLGASVNVQPERTRPIVTPESTPVMIVKPNATAAPTATPKPASSTGGVILGDEGRKIMLPEAFDSSIPKHTKSGYLDGNKGYYYVYSKQSSQWFRFESYVNALVNSGYYGVVYHSEESYGDRWCLQYIGPKYAGHKLGYASDIEVEVFGDDVYVEHVDDIKTGSEPTSDGGGGGGDCSTCGGDGKCNNCGGDGWWEGYEWVRVNGFPESTYVTKFCNDVYCLAGSCDRCGGDGCLND